MASNDILESWEDFTDYEAPQGGKSKKSKARSENSEDAKNGVFVTEESHRTQYKPQIRILKREPQESKRNGNVNSNVPNGPNGPNDGPATEAPSETKPKAKTLAQREAEYAEARRRILGPSYNPEEQQQPPLPPPSVQPPFVPPFPPPPPVPSIADLVPPYPPPPILPVVNHHVHQPPPPPSTYDDNSPRRLAQRMENLKMNPGPGVIVVRQPNGPDPDGFRGFSGFKSQDMRR